MLLDDTAWTETLGEQARRIANRDVSSVELVNVVLGRLERLEPRLNAFITVLADEARAAARRADSEIARGAYRGRLHGVPVSLKDMFVTEGARTTGGSKLLVDWVPSFDSAVAERLRSAGAIVIGKTNQDQLGHGGANTYSHFGPVHNPWDLDRIAGGSSGGSAASIAAGIGALSYGTETGSSIRRPAAFCGIVGFKPTFGRISRHGVLHSAWSMDHVGVFARTIEDAALGVDIVAGYDHRDPASVPGGTVSHFEAIRGKARGLRLGVLQAFLDDSSVQPEIWKAFRESLAIFTAAGASVEAIDIPELQYAAMTSSITGLAESGACERQWLRDRPDDFVPEVRRASLTGLAFSAAEYLTVQRARFRIREAVRLAFEQIDILAAPTTGRVAPLISEGTRGLGDEVHSASLNQANLLRFPSMLGLPACSIPCGKGTHGLPIGMQLIGRWFDDQLVFDIALAFQQATDWHHQRPNLG